MKIKEFDFEWNPEGIDKLCKGLCGTLNQLPSVETYESCEGHGERPYWIFFRCTDIETISRLGRCVAKNYSDGNWEIIVDSCDGNPYGCFWLRTKTTLKKEELVESIERFIDSIYYWFDDEFDDYFCEPINNNQPEHGYFETIFHCGKEPRWKAGDVLAYYEFYSDHEGEEILGPVIRIEFKDDEQDWCYWFKHENREYYLTEAELLENETYIKKI